ncbi:carbohydrate ABC transporter permease [Microbacter sp. GSS18]|nr:carbohydrate ABC transporter permease [Microbacter sp. GSS18]
MTSSSSRVRTALSYGALTIVAVFMLLPFVWVLSGSLKSQAEFMSNPGGWLPESFEWQNYVALFTEKGFSTYFANSGIVVAIAVLANIVLSAMAGYALAKLEFRGKPLVMAGVIIAMAVPYVAVFVPQFVVVVQLGAVDTLLGIVLPILVLPISVFVMRQFAYSIPGELLEAARVDGAGEWRIFARIFMPLAGPALATVGILSFLAAWNAFLWPLIVAQSQDTYTLPVGLASAAQGSNTLDYGILLAGAVVILLPVLILFLFLQRYFIQGVATAGLK